MYWCAHCFVLSVWVDGEEVVFARNASAREFILWRGNESAPLVRIAREAIAAAPPRI
jgi:hypothetical protein